MTENSGPEFLIWWPFPPREVEEIQAHGGKEHPPSHHASLNV